MSAPASAGRPPRPVAASRVAFALTMAALGALGAVTRDFASVWEPVPDDVPARAALKVLCAVIPLAAGLGLLWRPTAPAAGRVLLGFLLSWLVVLKLPLIVRSPTVGFWHSSCQTAMVAAAAWLLEAGSEEGRQQGGALTSAGGLRLARGLYGVALIPIGLAHFLYLEATAPLVPGWLPAPAAWAYATGGALMAAGLGAILRVWGRLAVTLSALEIGLFTLLVWVPVLAAGSTDEGQWTEFIASFELTIVAWVVADSYRGRPWLAVGRGE